MVVLVTVTVTVALVVLYRKSGLQAHLAGGWCQGALGAQ